MANNEFQSDFDLNLKLRIIMTYNDISHKTNT